MFWWNKENSDVLFMDKREVPKGAFPNGWNPNWSVQPDEVADFRDMPFPDESFKMVVFDPPHLTSGSMKSVINKKYGLLNKDTWKEDIVAGFNECWRVLEPNGILIFKWNEANIKAKELLRSFPVEPLFGDFTGKTGKTIWVTFMKPAGSKMDKKLAMCVDILRQVVRERDCDPVTEARIMVVLEKVGADRTAP
jgi:SAM-dependent methyltransferase